MIRTLPLWIVPLSVAVFLGQAPSPNTPSNGVGAVASQTDQDRVSDQIAVNLGYIHTALDEYAGQHNNMYPQHIGDLVRLVPSIDNFFMPNTVLPNEVRFGKPDQQAPWINMHTMFAFPAAGARAGTISSSGVLVYERPDLSPQKPRLAVLYGDGHVDTADRADLEKALQVR